eukprot:Skav211165  [mRNA]  locus=scaffold413:556088:568377:+ [translate_table: standard]
MSFCFCNRNQARASRRKSQGKWHSCTVQFSSPVYLVAEESEEVILDVIRVGPTDKQCEVEVKTFSGTAKEGQEFQATHLTISFEPNEVLKSVHVSLFDNTRWDTHMEFYAKLMNPLGGVLGEYLSEASVRIIAPGRRQWHCTTLVAPGANHGERADDDLFPSNRFKEEIVTNNFEGVRCSTALSPWQYTWPADRRTVRLPSEPKTLRWSQLW